MVLFEIADADNLIAGKKVENSNAIVRIVAILYEFLLIDDFNLASTPFSSLFPAL